MDKPIFDSTPAGELVSAERNDEPGNENRLLNDGGSADGGGMPRKRFAGDMRASLAKGRQSGDWAWHPERNLAFPQFGMPAFKPHKHPLDGIRFTLKDGRSYAAQ